MEKMNSCTLLVGNNLMCHNGKQYEKFFKKRQKGWSNSKVLALHMADQASIPSILPFPLSITRSNS